MDRVTGRVSGYRKKRIDGEFHFRRLRTLSVENRKFSKRGGGYLFIKPARTGNIADTAAGGVQQARRELDEDCGMVLLCAFEGN